jgi:hypothetical protein
MLWNTNRPLWTVRQLLLASQFDAQLGIEMALLHVRLLPGAFVIDVAAMLCSIRRLDDTDGIR